MQNAPLGDFCNTFVLHKAINGLLFWVTHHFFAPWVTLVHQSWKKSETLMWLHTTYDFAEMPKWIPYHFQPTILPKNVFVYSVDVHSAKIMKRSLLLWQSSIRLVAMMIYHMTHNQISSHVNLYSDCLSWPPALTRSYSVEYARVLR